MNEINLTKEEQLDILDYFLQYKQELNNDLTNNWNDLTIGGFDTFFYFIRENGLMPKNYLESYKKIKKKYEKTDIGELSKEKLDLSEIITIFVFVPRADRFCDGWYEECEDKNVYYNLLCRLEEIRNELINK